MIVFEEDYLEHHGIKGQKWGVRRFQEPNGSARTTAGKIRYDEMPEGKKGSASAQKIANEKPGTNSTPSNNKKPSNTQPQFDSEENKSRYSQNKQMIKNRDGSMTIPKDFRFNRVGGESLDPNKAGGLYASYGVEDAARYIKNLGPSFWGKTLGTAHYHVQHISVKEPIKMASEEQVTKIIGQKMKDNPKLLSSFNESLYSTLYTNDWDTKITQKDIQRMIDDPSNVKSKKLAYSVFGTFGDTNGSAETKQFYDAIMKAGFDAVPDMYDQYTGTSTSATIILNQSKLEITSKDYISKDYYKQAKKYTKKLMKLKENDIVNS